jgi:hypothetical protein
MYGRALHPSCDLLSPVALRSSPFSFPQGEDRVRGGPHSAIPKNVNALATEVTEVSEETRITAVLCALPVLCGKVVDLHFYALMRS